MIKKTLIALAFALAVGVGSPSIALADRGYHGHHGHHRHHGHHGHWGGHGHWHRPVVYPPIYVGGYYPVRTYYAAPYYPYGYYGYYGSGVNVSVGW